ncbi:MAG: phosphatidate cytidylyltransferase [Clostridia bacterium]|nr:phosphatidate cytidylyltransferase [Clostridia bacterium]
MKKRIITACIGVPIIIVALIYGGWVAELLISFFTIIALKEYNDALVKAGYSICPWGGYLAAMLMWPLARMKGALDPLILVTAAMGVSMTGVILSKEPSFPNASASVYPIFTALLPMSMFMMMMSKQFGQVSGKALVAMAFSIALVGDASAYFGGRLWGKRKLCPKVSPKKTVEGAICYLAGGIVASLICRAVFVYGLHKPMPGIPAAILLGILGAVAGQIGDLSASLLKRYCGIKDYGKIFPGHGGVMDRFDSVIFTLIVLYCYTLVL